MTKHVALWRAVNLPSHKKLAMADLRELLVELKYTEPKTLLQSGNAIFGSKKSAAADEKALEQACAKRFGLTTEVLVRDAPAWARILAANPFPAEAKKDPAHLVVMVLRGKPDPEAVAELDAAGRERVAAGEGCLYLTYPDGIGESKLARHSAWKRLGAVGTGRNWNTAQKIAALLA